MLFTIEREAKDRLSTQEWNFDTQADYLSMLHIRLYLYRAMSRPTRRHNYRGDRWWCSIDTSTATIRRDEILIPQDVIAELREQIIETVKNLEVQ